MRLNSQPSHIVSFLPGMTTCARWGHGVRPCWWARQTGPGCRTSQFSRSVDPSALLRGRATKPMGWSLRQLRRSSRRRPSAMPAISLVRRGLRGAAGGSRRVGRAGSERASAAVVATVPVAVLPVTAAAGLSAREIRARAVLGAAMALHLRPAPPRRVQWAVFGRPTGGSRYVLDSFFDCARAASASRPFFRRVRGGSNALFLPAASTVAPSARVRRRRRWGREQAGRRTGMRRIPRRNLPILPYEAEEEERMNEWRQTRGAAAAGASTSSSRGGVAEQIAAQQHPATHPAALSNNARERQFHS